MLVGCLLKLSTKPLINNCNKIDNIDNIDNNDNSIIEKLKCSLFFNPILDDVKYLIATKYFQKMLSEYYEKKIINNTNNHMTNHTTNNTTNKLAELFINANNKFKETIKWLGDNMNYLTCECDIALISLDNYMISYKNYKKNINFNRYYNLLKNYEKPFPYDLIKMLLRYSIFNTSSQQWSIGDNLYYQINEIFDVDFEMFASPLNFNLNIFCSIFPDTDMIFGSIGSFYNIQPEFLLNKCIRGVIYNPPYIPSLLDTTIQICINLLYKMEKMNKEFTIISFLPNWLDAPYIQYFIKSKFVIAYKSMKKGTYMLQEKDTGKLIKGTFDLLVVMLNSGKEYMNEEMYEDDSKKFKILIKNMKNEINEINI